jgi:anti-sigma regulatory factor (Ser/Thr protein kinase)
MCRVVSQSFRRGPQAAAQSRSLLNVSLARWELPELSRTAALLTSELVTNALVHAHTPVRLVVAVSDGKVEVGVTDWDPHKPRLRRHLPPWRSAPSGEDPRPGHDGRGLLLVHELADEWGTADVTAGKQVWFSLKADSWPYRNACACHGADLERVRLGSGRFAVDMPEPWVLPPEEQERWPDPHPPNPPT